MYFRCYFWNGKLKAIPNNAKGEIVSYEEAITTAEDNKSLIDFDNDTYNLTYTYSDDNNLTHKVYFTDAATNFNVMRFAQENPRLKSFECNATV